MFKNKKDSFFTLISITVLWIIIVTIFKISYISFESLKIFTTSVTLSIIIRSVFIIWFWKITPFRYIHDTPILEGEWLGNFKSSWKNQDGLPATESICAKISQPDIFSVFIEQTTKESVSRSYGEELKKSGNETYILSYSYLNEPNANIRDKSSIAYGSVRYIINIKSLSIKGNYWTDKKTTGTVELKKV